MCTDAVAFMVLLRNSANPYRNTPHTVVAIFVIGRFSRTHPFIDEGVKSAQIHIGEISPLSFSERGDLPGWQGPVSVNVQSDRRLCLRHPLTPCVGSQAKYSLFSINLLASPLPLGYGLK
jgi:hypothetical protein